jgi:hypothetical protein
MLSKLLFQVLPQSQESSSISKSEFAEVTYYDDRIQAGCFRRRRTIGKYL